MDQGRRVVFEAFKRVCLLIRLSDAAANKPFDMSADALSNARRPMRLAQRLTEPTPLMFRERTEMPEAPTSFVRPILVDGFSIQNSIIDGMVFVTLSTPSLDKVPGSAAFVAVFTADRARELVDALTSALEGPATISAETLESP